MLSTLLANKTLIVFALWTATSLAAHAGCEQRLSQNQRFTACSYDRDEARLEVFNLNDEGEPYGYLATLAQALRGQNQNLLFAMNAGMYDENQRPIGLYVEDGQQSKKLNRRSGGGNFHLKPNGVFYVKDGKPFVVETESFAKSGVKPDFATQSGPMLVINGRIHPKFSPNGTSRKLRNGVGIDDQGKVTFVISDNAVTFWEFATLFKDDLQARNALFFDGSVSSLYAPEINRNDGFLPLGPMVGAIKIE
jgi:prepilin-type processing-associated H-X9-DG protein